jgi:hypothetical protein
MNYEAFFTRRKKVLRLLIFFYCKKNSIENWKVYTALNDINRGFYVLTNNKEFVNCNQKLNLKNKINKLFFKNIEYVF